MNSKNLIFVGSRNKMEYLFIAADLNGYNIVGILDHHYYTRVDNRNGVPFIGDERWLLDSTNVQAQKWLSDCVFFPANWWMGTQPVDGELDLLALRKSRIDILEKSKANVINLLSPGQWINDLNSKFSSTKLGKGIFVSQDVHISAFDVLIGDYCCIEQGIKIGPRVVLGHNVCIAPFTTLARCVIEDDCYIGLDSKLLPKDIKAAESQITIGKNSTVWAFSNVGVDVPGNSIHTYHGRILKKQKFLNH